MKARFSTATFFMVFLMFAVSILLVSGCKKGSTGQSSAGSESTGSKTQKIEKNRSRNENLTSENDKNTDEKQSVEKSEGEAVDESSEIIRTAVHAARANNPSLPELVILAVKTARGWARVDLEPVDRSTDAASVLLKRSGGSWVVVDMGTGIGPETYPEAPQEVFE